jgi:hypothetical protein
LPFFNIFLLQKLPSQAPPQESIVQQSLYEPFNTEQTELLPIEDTVSLKLNSTQDPFTAFDESKLTPQELSNANAFETLVPIDTQAATSISAPISPLQIVKTKKGKFSYKAQQEKQTAVLPDTSLDFEVENKTGKTVYVTCFAYMKKQPFSRWRWDKSEVYRLEDNQKTTIFMHRIKDEQDRINTFGYLAVLDTQKEADNAIYELLPDRNKLELDLLIHLKGKTVVLEVEKYGIVGEFLDYDFVPKKQTGVKFVPEVDFVVENHTGKTILVICFVFQKKAKGTWLAEKTKEAWTPIDETRDDMSVWRFDKTPLITLKPGEVGVVDVDTIIEPRDRREVQGYLAIFDEDERKKVDDSVYELLPAQNKVQLGKLVNLKGKKVVIEIEKYGTLGDLIDYTVKPVSNIDFAKLDRSKTPKRSQAQK